MIFPKILNVIKVGDPRSGVRLSLRAAAGTCYDYVVIDICLNGEERQIADESALPELLRHFAMPEKRVAIERNGTVVSRADWPKTILREGDKIEIVHFVGGG